jgi:hypothetical protein
MVSGIRQTKRAMAQRNFLRGPITDVSHCGREGKDLADSFPPGAFQGERIRSFLAASSWFWYCYTCFDRNEGG